MMMFKIILSAAMLAALSGHAVANDWPRGMRDALEYCRSSDVDPHDAMDGVKLLTDKQCARRFLRSKNNSTPTLARACYETGDTKHVTLTGEIVQSVTTQANDGTGELAGVKYFAIALDKPICFKTDPTITDTVIRADPISKKWLGHYVAIVGNLTLDEDLSITVQSIKDAKIAAAKGQKTSAITLDSGECWGPPTEDFCGTHEDVQKYKRAYKRGADCSTGTLKSQQNCKAAKSGKFD
jgi:hypothetical protein